MRIDQNTIPSLPAFIASSEDWQDEIRRLLNSKFDQLISAIDHRSIEPIEELYDAFLAKLGFEGQIDREHNINAAAERTFEWVFRDPDPTLARWTNFVDWLENGDGIYWVTGKAGSGKSTLLKFLQRHAHTTRSLSRWAGTSRLIVSSFYFWNSGSALQMSQEGMLRTLLYQVASQVKECIPQIAPQRWSVTKVFREDAAGWAMGELLQALDRLTSSDFSNLRLFFFIDGLDEFAGRHEEIISLLERLGSHPHIKLCISSRPWVVFEDAFHMKPSLRMQDLIGKDIETYVDTKLHGSERFLRLEKLSPSVAKDFIHQIASKASGVFLWVTLVVRELLRGIQDGDRLSDLQQRLDAMPSDLYAFFAKMLSGPAGGPQNNLERASQLLRLRLRGEITVYALALADEDGASATSGTARKLSEGEMHWLVDSMNRRLNSITRGLLELSHTATLAKTRGKAKVEYLHRTVRDFVESPETRRLLGQFAFDCDLALCQSFVLQLKYLGRATEPAVHPLMRRALQHGALCGLESQDKLHSLIDCMNTYIEAFRRKEGPLGFKNQGSHLPVVFPFASKIPSWQEKVLQQQNDPEASTMGEFQTASAGVMGSHPSQPEDSPGRKRQWGGKEQVNISKRVKEN